MWVNKSKFLIKNLIQSATFHICRVTAFTQVYLGGDFEIDISFKDRLAKKFVILYKLVNSARFRDVEINSIYATRGVRPVSQMHLQKRINDYAVQPHIQHRGIW